MQHLVSSFAEELPLRDDPRSFEHFHRELRRAAEQWPAATFRPLVPLAWRRDVLEQAWRQVRSREGAPGLDGVSVHRLEAAGVREWLEDVREELRTGRYRPLPLRCLDVPKGRGATRRLSIPAVRDRLVQAAVKLVLEPIYEADFLPCSHGYRPRRGVKTATHQVIEAVRTGHHHVVDADVAACFDSLPHAGVRAQLERRVSDPLLLRWLGWWTAADVVHDGQVLRVARGVPQGGVVSPLLSNVYLHQLDLRWQPWQEEARLVRYCDDLVVLCRGDAAGWLDRLQGSLAELGLVLSPSKTRITHARDGFDFLGLTFRGVVDRRDRQRLYCLVKPSDESLRRLREKLAGAGRRKGSVAELIQRFNAILRPWLRNQGARRTRSQARRLRRFVLDRLIARHRREHGVEGDRPVDSAIFRRLGLIELCRRRR
ncbi:MAG: group II intron reverse transcriptase/maturase [Acidobacteriota bacterium]